MMIVMEGVDAFVVFALIVVGMVIVMFIRSAVRPGKIRGNRACRRCGTVLPAFAKFCRQCGEAT